MASSAFYNTNIRTGQDNGSDSDSDNELVMTGDIWPTFIVMKSASEDKPMSKLSSFAVQKGFQAIAGTLKSTKRLSDGSLLVECSRRTQTEKLLTIVNFLDRPVHVYVHETLTRPEVLTDVVSSLICQKLRSGIHT